MAGKWLYSVDYEGVRVTPEFMERLQIGNAAALRALKKQNLSFLYRNHFTRQPRRADAHGLFWSDIPDTALIPLVRGGRSRIRPWLPDYVVMSAEAKTARRGKAVARYAGWLRRSLPPDQELYVKFERGGKVTATKMKPNPKFELVVVNRFDKAALLKLLGELDSTVNVEQWLKERTVRQGATAHKPLHTDYKAWCEQRGETAAGTRSFADALIAAGVVKLTRSNAAQRYELELR